MLTDVEECKSVIQSIFLDEKTDFVRRFRLKVAVLDVKYLIEEAAYMEAETILFLLRKNLCIFVIKDPTALREGELQLVTIICSVIRRNDRGDLRYIEMSYAHELVVYLLLLCLKLHLVWKRLPFASAAYAEVLAERFQTMLRRLYHTEDESFHIVFLLLCDLYVNNVSRYCKLHEKHSTIDSCQSLAFCCNRLDHNIF